MVIMGANKSCYGLGLSKKSAPSDAPKFIVLKVFLFSPTVSSRLINVFLGREWWPFFFLFVLLLLPLPFFCGGLWGGGLGGGGGDGLHV